MGILVLAGTRNQAFISHADTNILPIKMRKLHKVAVGQSAEMLSCKTFQSYFVNVGSNPTVECF